MDIYEIKDVLINSAEYSPEKVNSMDAYDLIDAWLTWEGIIGYTTDIITAVLSVHKEMDLGEYIED